MLMSDIQKLWEKAGNYLKDKLGATTFETWIAPLRPSLQNERDLILEAPDSFFCDWVDKHYRPVIQEALKSSGQQEITVNLQVKPSSKNTPGTGQPEKAQEPRPTRTVEYPNLNLRYTFENFVVGPSNRHAHAYSLAVAESPAKAYNPLFIYGGVGLGKTHLMQAICHHIKNKWPRQSKNLLYDLGKIYQRTY